MLNVSGLRPPPGKKVFPGELTVVDTLTQLHSSGTKSTPRGVSGFSCLLGCFLGYVIQRTGYGMFRIVCNVLGVVKRACCWILFGERKRLGLGELNEREKRKDHKKKENFRRREPFASI